MLAQEEDLDETLSEAGCCGNVEIMKLLLAGGLKIRSNQQSQRTQNGMKTVFDAAIQSGHKDMVRFLIGQGCDPNPPADAERSGPFVRAVSGGHKLVMIVLLEAGADPNVSDRCRRRQALEIAAAAGRADLDPHPAGPRRHAPVNAERTEGAAGHFQCGKRRAYRRAGPALGLRRRQDARCRPLKPCARPSARGTRR